MLEKINEVEIFLTAFSSSNMQYYKVGPKRYLDATDNKKTIVCYDF